VLAAKRRHRSSSAGTCLSSRGDSAIAGISVRWAVRQFALPMR
jgi:hypothetical protein